MLPTFTPTVVFMFVVFFCLKIPFYFAKSDEAFFKMDYSLSSGIMDVWGQFFWPYLDPKSMDDKKESNI